MTGNPDFAGTVWSMAAIDSINADGKPYFTFSLYLEPENSFVTLYFDLNKPGSHSVVSVVCAAYVAQTSLDVFLESPVDRFVKFLQASKPPKKPDIS